MAHVIYKQQFQLGESELLFPMGAKILSVKYQHGSPTIWYLVDVRALETTPVRREIMVAPTGGIINVDMYEWEFIDTFSDTWNPIYVWHLFIKKETP